MTVFDPTLEAAPITETNLDPILPEDRFILELIGFERSGPDQFRKDGGIKWTFLVYDMDGRPFEFKDEHYQLWRTTDIDRNGKPLFNLNTQAHAWACALLGRDLGEADNFSVSELRNKRMSTMIVWRNKRPPAKGKTFDMASLRHVSVSGSAPAAAPLPAAGQVSANPSEDEIDRALMVTKLTRQVERLKKLDATAGARAEAAVEMSDLTDAPLKEIHGLLSQVQAAISTALED